MAIEGGNDIREFMDKLQQLQGLLGSAKKTFTGMLGGDSVKVNRTELDELASALAASVPDLLPKANEIVVEEGNLIGAARQQAESIVQDARQQAAQIAAQSKAEFEQMQTRIQEAQAQAQQIESDGEARKAELANQASAQAASIVEDGKRQAEQIVAEGQAQADQLVQQENILRRAQIAAQELTESTQADMAQLRQKTFALLDDMLGKGEGYITSIVQELHQERENLNGMR